jgi:hypothetical protein
LPPGVTGASNTNSITVNFGLGALSGNIIVRGVNNYGAGGFSSKWVTVNPIPATPVISQGGNILTSNAPSGNQWYNSSGIIIGATNSNYAINSNDNYFCIVTMAGCGSDTSNVINAVLTGLSTIENKYSFTIYPNPFTSRTTLRTDIFLNNATLSVYNCFGQVVTKIENISGQTVTLFRDNLPSGLYFIRMTERNKIIVADKLVITN